MKHSVPQDIKNSELIIIIDEYVRNERDREILKDRWIKGYTFERLAEKHRISVTQIKNIIYGIGDKVLLKVSEIFDK